MSRLEHDWYPADLPVNVEIGEGSWLYSTYAFLHYRSTQPQGVRIGSDTGIYDGTFFDLGPNGSIKIGNYSTIVGAIINTDSFVEIGDYCLIAHEVVLADESCTIPGLTTSICPGESTKQDIKIGNNCWIAAGAILLRGAHIGDHSIVGAHTLVDFEVPAAKMVVGRPARILDLPRTRNDTCSKEVIRSS